MKQSISKEQWDELDDEQQKSLVFNKSLRWKTNHFWKEITIGQLIEFLGYDFNQITTTIDLEYVIQIWGADEKEPTYFHKKELIDALWEAVKHKLKS